MSCDAVEAEASKTYDICKELKKSKNEEIIKYVTYVNDHPVFITASNFLEINRRTILSIIGIVTNYLIVILQFHGISFQSFHGM